MDRDGEKALTGLPEILDNGGGKQIRVRGTH